MAVDISLVAAYLRAADFEYQLASAEVEKAGWQKPLREALLRTIDDKSATLAEANVSVFKEFLIDLGFAA